jgi:hypothetical protein
VNLVVRFILEGKATIHLEAYKLHIMISKADPDTLNRFMHLLAEKVLLCRLLVSPLLPVTHSLFSDGEKQAARKGRCRGRARISGIQSIFGHAV